MKVEQQRQENEKLREDYDRLRCFEDQCLGRTGDDR